jgi:hypothetical protein
MFVGGTILFFSVWQLNIASAIVNGESHQAIPVVGPFLMAHDRLNRPCADAYNGVITSRYSCAVQFDDRAYAAVQVINGLLQATGVILALAGLTTKHRVRVRDKEFSIAPTGTPTGAGLLATGRF